MEVFSEDCRFPLIDLLHHSLHSLTDGLFTSNFTDIDHTSDLLGIPWEPPKDTDFAFQVLFIGLLWDLLYLTVGLGDSKRVKYLAAITEWLLCPTHVLLNVQKLYGKLLHACLIIHTG
jgi:hypothetical protein